MERLRSEISKLARFNVFFFSKTVVLNPFLRIASVYLLSFHLL